MSDEPEPTIPKQPPAPPVVGRARARLVAAALTPTISVVGGGLICIAGVFVIAALMPDLMRYSVPAATETAPVQEGTVPRPPGSG